MIASLELSIASSVHNVLRVRSSISRRNVLAAEAGQDARVSACQRTGATVSVELAVVAEVRLALRVGRGAGGCIHLA